MEPMPCHATHTPTHSNASRLRLFTSAAILNVSINNDMPPDLACCKQWNSCGARGVHEVRVCVLSMCTRWGVRSPAVAFAPADQGCLRSRFHRCGTPTGCLGKQSHAGLLQDVSPTSNRTWSLAQKRCGCTCQATRVDHQPTTALARQAPSMYVTLTVARQYTQYTGSGWCVRTTIHHPDNGDDNNSPRHRLRRFHGVWNAVHKRKAEVVHKR